MKIPESIIKMIEESWKEPGITAQCILKQSDFYIENPKSTTPWDKEFARRSQLAYYLPLNLVRSLRTFSQLKSNPLRNYQDFFSTIENYWELGSGLSPSYFALLEEFPNLKFANVNFIESSAYAQELHKNLLDKYLQIKKTIAADSDKTAGLSTAVGSAAAGTYSHQWTRQHPSKDIDLSQSLVVCSYSLTELDSPPDWLFRAKALIIIEPATREDGRKLLKLRNQLIERGYLIWAPCLHQQACPLLAETKNDWCHDRIHFEKPEALQKIENLLPIKNETLTFSYLIAHKRSDNKIAVETLVRVTGDFLNEKGKSKQMVCRNSRREFLTQLKRHTDPMEYQRGDLLKIEGPVKLVGNEIRLIAGSD
jgi:hypothetical protein